MRGLGRSYGDQALANELYLNVLPKKLNLTDDVLRCSSSVSIEEVNEFLKGRAMRLKVTPGTEMISIGGAVANDVHGKNHVVDGSFACHIEELTILNKNGLQSVSSNDDLFKATVGGSGLTGLIVSVAIRVEPAEGDQFLVKTSKYDSIDAACRAIEVSTARFKSCWIKSRKEIVVSQADWTNTWTKESDKSGKIRFGLFGLATHSYVLKQFEKKRYSRIQEGESVQSLREFMYPLDRWSDWNRLYKKGFVQLQFVCSTNVFPQLVSETIEYLEQIGTHPYITTIKQLGPKSSGGWMSFPEEGFCFTTDIIINEHQREQLKPLLDRIVDNGGKFYLAKDAIMGSEHMVNYKMLDQYKSYLSENKFGIQSMQARRLKLTS